MELTQEVKKKSEQETMHHNAHMLINGVIEVLSDPATNYFMSSDSTKSKLIQHIKEVLSKPQDDYSNLTLFTYLQANPFAGGGTLTVNLDTLELNRRHKIFMDKDFTHYGSEFMESLKTGKNLPNCCGGVFSDYILKGPINPAYDEKTIHLFDSIDNSYLRPLLMQLLEHISTGEIDSIDVFANLLIETSYNPILSDAKIMGGLEQERLDYFLSMLQLKFKSKDGDGNNSIDKIEDLADSRFRPHIFKVLQKRSFKDYMGTELFRTMVRIRTDLIDTFDLICYYALKHSIPANTIFESFPGVSLYDCDEKEASPVLVEKYPGERIHHLREMIEFFKELESTSMPFEWALELHNCCRGE